MTERLSQFLFALRYTYNNPVDRQRARGLLIIIQALLMLWVLGLIAIGIYIMSTSSSLSEVADNRFWGVSLIPLFALALYQLIQTGHLTAASYLFLLFVFASSISATDRLDTSASTVFFPSLVAGILLLGRRGTIISVLVILVFVFVGAIEQAQINSPSNEIPSDRVLADVSLVLLMVLFASLYLYAFSSNTQAIVDESLNETDMYRRVGQFAVELNIDTTEDQVFIRLLNTIRVITGADFVRLFLVDDTEEIYRRITLNLDRLESFEVDTEQFNVIGPLRQTIHSKEQFVVTLEDNPLRRSHLLPSAVFAVTVPLLHLDRLIGVVDIQLTRPTLSDVHLQVAQLIAYQAAQYISQMRSSRALRAELDQRNLMLTNLRSRMKDFDENRRIRTTSDAISSESSNYVHGYDFSKETGVVTPADQLSDEMLEVLKRGEPYVQTVEGVHQISVPIQRSDEILGAMAFELPPDAMLTDRQVDLARSIAGRLAVAMDNRRLFEQSYMQAERERKAGEIANELISLTNVEAVLSEAATAFNNALGAVGTQIHVQLPTSEDSVRSASQNGGG